MTHWDLLGAYIYIASQFLSLSFFAHPLLQNLFTVTKPPSSFSSCWDASIFHGFNLTSILLAEWWLEIWMLPVLKGPIATVSQIVFRSSFLVLRITFARAEKRQTKLPFCKLNDFARSSQPSIPTLPQTFTIGSFCKWCQISAEECKGLQHDSCTAQQICSNPKSPLCISGVTPEHWAQTILPWSCQEQEQKQDEADRLQKTG